MGWLLKSGMQCEIQWGLHLEMRNDQVMCPNTDAWEEVQTRSGKGCQEPKT